MLLRSMRAHQKAQHEKPLRLETESRFPRKNQAVEHVFASYRAFNIEIVDFNWNSLHLMRQNVLRHKTMVAMTLDLQLKLIEVDALEVQIVFKPDHSVLLWLQFALVRDPLIAHPIVLKSATTAKVTHPVHSLTSP